MPASVLRRHLIGRHGHRPVADMTTAAAARNAKLFVEQQPSAS